MHKFRSQRLVTSSIAAIAFLFLINLPVGAQQNNSPPNVVGGLCPTIYIECPDTVKESNTFKAIISEDLEGQEITYTWTVSNATIISGQGTPSITVVADPGKTSITAVVSLGGLDPSCQASSACTMTWCLAPSARRVDLYQRLTLSQERERLDKFAVQLQNDPIAMGYVIAHGRGRGRGERAKRYLVEKYGFDPARIVSVKGGHREKSAVELYIVPPGAVPPNPAQKEGRSSFH